MSDKKKEPKNKIGRQEDSDISSDYGVEIISKITRLKKELTDCKKLKNEYLAGWQRAKADFINFKNEEDKNQSKIIAIARETLLLELLPLADSFDMAIANQQAWQETPANWRQGVEYIHQQLISFLNDHGVKKIEAEDKDFDPIFHESVGTVDVSDPKVDHKILTVVKNGYLLNGKVIRPAQVKVGIFKKNN